MTCQEQATAIKKAVKAITGDITITIGSVHYMNATATGNTKTCSQEITVSPKTLNFVQIKENSRPSRQALYVRMVFGDRLLIAKDRQAENLIASLTEEKLWPSKGAFILAAQKVKVIGNKITLST
ncbi:MAG: hypothetical protein RI935_522 [Candidatus Parcubacteria bacterium]